MLKSTTKRLIITKGTFLRPNLKGWTIVTFEELLGLIKNGSIIRHFKLYEEGYVYTFKNKLISKPFVTLLILRLMCKKRCWLEDESGERILVSLSFLTRLCIAFLVEFIKKRNLLRHLKKELNWLMGYYKEKAGRSINIKGNPVYLRTDLLYGFKSGGSIAHIAGVINNLDGYFDKPVFLTTDDIPTVRQDIEKRIIVPDGTFSNFKYLPGFHFNSYFTDECVSYLVNTNISFIYQRYSLNNYSGVKLSKHFNAVFILEYNGSEVWICNNWGEPLKYNEISMKIELLNLLAADVIIVVSQPLKDELIGRGVKEDKIIVNPNGVDPEIYSPATDGSAVRKKNGLEGKTVIGFIGTFGKWHGAEVLTESFGKLLEEYPSYRERLRLLLVGDGLMMPTVKEKIEILNIQNNCILTGRIPQEEGASYLAACDILSSPHIPNADGTVFFGSPTKIFEYMSMGRGIVASDLGQLSVVLEHGRTAWLVKPGDTESLKNGLKKLIDDEETRNRLGMNARSEVMEKYTWKIHVKRIAEKIRNINKEI